MPFIMSGVSNLSDFQNLFLLKNINFNLSAWYSVNNIYSENIHLKISKTLIHFKVTIDKISSDPTF